MTLLYKQIPFKYLSIGKMNNTEVSYDFLCNIIKLHRDHPFIIEKIITARPELWGCIESDLQNHTYEELVVKDYSGLLYPKWIKQDDKPPIDILINATVLDKPNFFKVIAEKYRRIGR